MEFGDIAISKEALARAHTHTHAAPYNAGENDISIQNAYSKVFAYKALWVSLTTNKYLFLRPLGKKGG